jgi:hypothetical protein
VFGIGKKNRRKVDCRKDAKGDVRRDVEKAIYFRHLLCIIFFFSWAKGPKPQKQKQESLNRFLHFGIDSSRSRAKSPNKSVHESTSLRLDPALAHSLWHISPGLPGVRFVGHFCRFWPNGKAAGRMETSHSAIVKSGRKWPYGIHAPMASSIFLNH